MEGTGLEKLAGREREGELRRIQGKGGKDERGSGGGVRFVWLSFFLPGRLTATKVRVLGGQLWQFSKRILGGSI